jgi:hypothetical protein
VLAAAAKRCRQLASVTYSGSLAWEGGGVLLPVMPDSLGPGWAVGSPEVDAAALALHWTATRAGPAAPHRRRRRR